VTAVGSKRAAVRLEPLEPGLARRLDDARTFLAEHKVMTPGESERARRRLIRRTGGSDA